MYIVAILATTKDILRKKAVFPEKYKKNSQIFMKMLAQFSLFLLKNAFFVLRTLQSFAVSYI